MAHLNSKVGELGEGGSPITAAVLPNLSTSLEGSQLAWHCARTKPKHEHIVAGGLKRNLGIEVFHPSLRVERSTRRGVVRVIEPLFPCYVFVRCNIGDCLDKIRFSNGVSSLVHFGDRIPAIPDDVVEELMLCFESHQPMDLQDQLCPGAEVVVGEGAFQGFNGIVLRILPAKRRVQILLDFLGRTTLAEVDRNSLVVENRSLADVIPSLAVPRNKSS